MTAANREGDKVQIAGAYQHNALHKGNVFQRNWHRLKLQQAVKVAACITADDVLDVGCGSGTLIPFLPEPIHSYLGLDANEEAISFCQKTYTAPYISFRLQQIDSLQQLPSDSFSKIFFLETIEHITAGQGQETLRQFHRLLQPGGVCTISTPNRKSLWPVIERLLDLFRLTPRIKGEQHEKLYSIAELQKMAQEAGFTVQQIQTINGLAPWVSFLGTSTIQSVHRWEVSNKWFPGSLILMTLKK